MNFNVELPLNSLSFGQISYQILFEMFNRGLSPCIFPIANQTDISAFPENKDFNLWLKANIERANFDYKRSDKSLRLWHVNGSQTGISEKNILFTFFELDKITKLEQNILKNQHKVLVSSKYTQEVFLKSGIESIYCPLAFDNLSFKKSNKRQMSEDVTVWTTAGKFEPMRKAHDKIIRTWVRRFGNNPKHVLHLAISNSFLKPEDFNALLNQILEGKKYFNINLIPHVTTNNAYSQILNVTDIHLALSRGEGFDLPLFHSLCLGKNAIVLNAHVYKDYTNKDMVTYVEPTKMIDCVDNIFFHKDSPVNNGKVFDWEEEDLNKAFDVAMLKHQKQPLNIEGEKLKEVYTWQKSLDIILETLKD